MPDLYFASQDQAARPCPRCGSTDATPILYGYPSGEMADAAKRGEIELGGCIVWPEGPDFRCRDCHALLPWVARV